MFRREFLTTLAGGALGAAGAPRTNFVLILADDLGVSDLGCYGNKYFATPNLDRLASEGARFTDAYAACPVCSPTRASILTGRYPVRTGVTDWIAGRPSHEKGPIVTPRTATELKLEETTLAEALKPRGYKSVSVGKWHLGGAGFAPTDHGFDLNIGGTHSGSPPQSKTPYFGPWDLPGLQGGPGEFLTESLTRAACGFIEQNRANPYFLYLPHYTVHIPLNARQQEIERHKAKADGRYNPVYAAMVESLDASVGAVLDAIDKSGAADRTMVAFFSDNGGLRYEGVRQEAVTDNAPFRAGKGHLYEGGIRVPFIASWPGVIPAGSVCRHRFYFPDILPTICEAAGIEVRHPIDGISFWPTLCGKGKQELHQFLYWEFHEGGFRQAVRHGSWKAVRHAPNLPLELYDLQADPSETRNIAAQHPDIIMRIETYLKTARTDSKEFPIRLPKKK